MKVRISFVLRAVFLTGMIFLFPGQSPIPDRSIAAKSQIQATPPLDSFQMNMRYCWPGPVIGNYSLANGEPYVVEVSGTWSAWYASLWSSYCGEPDDAPEIPSPGITNGKVGCDAEYLYAAPRGKYWCEWDDTPPWKAINPIQFSLDGGVTWTNNIPTDTSYHPDHVYQFEVIGKGLPLRVRLNDSNTPADNYGVLTIKIFSPLADSLFDFKQNRNADGTKVPWADSRLFEIPACPTMETHGCAITSLTDVIASYGKEVLPDGMTTDPGTLNHYLGTLPKTHSGCNIIFDWAVQAINFNVLHNDFAAVIPFETRIQHIDDGLENNHLVIIGIGGHFIVLYKKATLPAPDGSPDYYIVDPYRYQPYELGDRSGKLLSRFYGTINQLKSTLHVVVVENSAPQPGRSWMIVAHSPVQLLITDPLGAQTGFNPTTQTYVQDISGSTYGLQQGLADDTGSTPPLPDILYFGQNHLSLGKYTVLVYGTGSGAYSLDFGVSNSVNDASFQTLTGTTRLGQIDTYTVNVEEGLPISIQRIEKSYLPAVYH